MGIRIQLMPNYTNCGRMEKRTPTINAKFYELRPDGRMHTMFADAKIWAYLWPY